MDNTTLIFHQLEQQLLRALAGKQEAVRAILICLLAKGHVLIEDVPGVGKTTLAQALAASLDSDFGRIQFTADLLPADIVGVEIYNPNKQAFTFHAGPIFHHIVLADEINRATPKAQSALLEAMGEGQVSIERETHQLPQPFFVIATQNPQEHLGTFPLPESQLDRFFMRIAIGYPDRASERLILLGKAGREQLQDFTPMANWQQVIAARKAIAAMPVSEALMDYILTLLEKTRNGDWLIQGVSPRAGRDVLRAAQANAWLNQQDYVSAADVQHIWLATLAHRVLAQGDSSAALQQIIEHVAIPA
ncbi:MAG: AAA family ATPase [Mariprofundaceae bacterium]|nr:AAA family ATPase [Mariprofundaceae bacterium]